MGLLPIILVIVGIICLFLGWRWQDPPNEETITALKGLAYLKREILQVQDQVHGLDQKLQRTKQVEEAAPKETEGNEKNNKLYVLNAKDQVLRTYNQTQPNPKPQSESTQPQPKLQHQSNMSPKYQEVLVLAERGQSIPEIAHHLSLSQDAVTMVLQMQPKGGAR
ncbi:DNA-binding response regulator [Desulfosporosinus sp. Sb-LF]|uniref:DNA-binding response regulator n=1 Tax=Desulfosporosinus sp. Sb-LF TaxID=2560027 RepID=UPI00107F3233|nr:DNA-binding response regulator [Desulfosporosinus sp. Sb-LF]TGE33147.1 DNA-binding response regulator [Desulfosporosinus sp. Sb-LF]